MSEVGLHNKRQLKAALEWLAENAEVNERGGVTISMGWVMTNAIILNSIEVGAPPLPAPVAKGIVRRALLHWVKEIRLRTEAGQRTDVVDSFTAHIIEQVAEAEGRQSEFTVVMLLNTDIRRVHNISSVLVHGQELQFVDWNHLAKMLNTEALWTEVFQDNMERSAVGLPQRVSGVFRQAGFGRQEDVSDQAFLSLRHNLFQPVLTVVRASSTGAAVAIAADSLDLLRATLNLTVSLGTWPLASSEPSPLSSILPSPLYGVFGDDGEYLGHHYTFEPYRYRKKPLGKENVEEALDLINQYNQASKDDLTRFLVQSLTLYQDGLDSTVDRTKFLALWQVLETLTLNSPDPKIQVEKRVATLLELHGKDDIARALVDVLARIRHDFVHEGVFPPTANSLVAALKFIVDSVIRRLFYLARHISTVPELEAYFRYASCSSSQFESLKREIEEEEARLTVDKTVLEKIRRLRDSL